MLFTNHTICNVPVLTENAVQGTSAEKYGAAALLAADTRLFAIVQGCAGNNGVCRHTTDTVLSVAAICAAAARTQLTIAEKRGSHTLIHKQGSFPIKETDIAVLILLRGQRTGRLGGGQFAIQQCLCAFNDLRQNIIGQIHAVVGGQDAGDG